MNFLECLLEVTDKHESAFNLVSDDLWQDVILSMLRQDTEVKEITVDYLLKEIKKSIFIKYKLDLKKYDTVSIEIKNGSIWIIGAFGLISGDILSDLTGKGIYPSTK